MAIVKAKIRLGLRPSAVDAFRFYGIIKGKGRTDGLVFSYIIEDIQSLNERVMRGELEVSTASVYTLFQIAGRYTLLNCGATVGEECGPIIVSKSLYYPKELKGKRIAVPGKWTTAYLVMRLYETEFEPVFAPSKEAVQLILDEKADAAVLIHDKQAVSGDQKLTKVIDLGEWFFEMTELPLPLSVDIMRTNLGPDLLRKLQRVLRDSVVYGFKHKQEALDYCMKYAGLHSREEIEQLVDLYVNDYTLNLGKKGKSSINFLYDSAKKAGFVRDPKTIQYVPK